MIYRNDMLALPRKGAHKIGVPLAQKKGEQGTKNPTFLIIVLILHLITNFNECLFC